MPDANLLLLVVMVLQDAGGLLPAGQHIGAEVPGGSGGGPGGDGGATAASAMAAGMGGGGSGTPLHQSNAADCIRQYLGDILEFLADIHTLGRLKNVHSAQSGAVPGLDEDTLGAALKASLGQYVALEMSRSCAKDQKAVARYLPWLYNAPSSLQQQGVKEYAECVAHMRTLAWLVLGTLTQSVLLRLRGGRLGQRGSATAVQHQPNHTHQQAMHAVSGGGSAGAAAPPIPQEASCHIAEHIQVIITGFAEQCKLSVSLMSALFNAFSMCLLWTVYLEQVALASPATSEPHNVTMGVLFEFWAKVTPSILQLATCSKSVSEIKQMKTLRMSLTTRPPLQFSDMVNLHFISLLEDLKETRSTVLVKLLPLWSPILSCTSQLSNTLHIRLQNCRDCTDPKDEQEHHAAEKLLKMLQKLQFKMGQIEVQSSQATQFYSI